MSALVEQSAAGAESLDERAQNLPRPGAVVRVVSDSGRQNQLHDASSTRATKKAEFCGAQDGGKKQQALPETLDDEWEEFC